MIDSSDFSLSDNEFSRVRERLYALAGISLSDAKRTLVVARLARLVRRLGLSSFSAYLDYLDRTSSPDETQEFINALTTNLTRFWREEHHFSHLAATIGRLIESRPASDRRLRIWSAGCSTGQEAYTIALSLLAQYPELARWDFRILATDIDTSVVARAATAIYSSSELSGLSAERAALFETLPDGNIRVPAAAAGLVTFKPLNLMDSWPMKGPFDAIFCRNVAIYFDRPTQSELFRRLAGFLAPGGFLYIGHSENLDAGATGLRLVGQTIYQLRAAADRKRDAA